MKIRYLLFWALWYSLPIARLHAGEERVPKVVQEFEAKLPEIGTLLGTLEKPREFQQWSEFPVPVFQSRQTSGELFGAVGVSENGEWIAVVNDGLEIWHASSRMLAYVTALPEMNSSGSRAKEFERAEPRGCAVSNDGRFCVIFWTIPMKRGFMEPGRIKGPGIACLIEMESGNVLHRWQMLSNSPMPAFSWNSNWLCAGDREGWFAIQLSGDRKTRKSVVTGEKEAWIDSTGRWWAVPSSAFPEGLRNHQMSGDGAVYFVENEVNDGTRGGKWCPGMENFELGVEPTLDNIGWSADSRLRFLDFEGDVLLDPLSLIAQKGPDGRLWWSGAAGSLWCRCYPPEVTAKTISWKSLDGKVIKVYQCKGTERINDLKVREDGKMVWISTMVDQGTGNEQVWKAVEIPAGKVVAWGKDGVSSLEVDFSPNNLEVLVGGALHELVAGRLIGLLPGKWIGVSSEGDILRAVSIGGDLGNDWRVVAYDFKGREQWKSGKSISAPALSELTFPRISADGQRAWLPSGFGAKVGAYLLNLREGQATLVADPEPLLLHCWTKDSSRLLVRMEGHGTRMFGEPWGAAGRVSEDTILPVQAEFSDVSNDPQGFLKIFRNGSGAILMDGNLKEVGDLTGGLRYDLISELSMSPDRRWLLARTSFGGEHSIWNIEKGFKVADVFAVGGGNWVIVLPNGYYACSPGAADAMALRWRGKPCALDRFDLKYNRPDLVIKAFEGDEKRAARFESMVKFRQKSGLPGDRSIPGSPAGSMDEEKEIKVLEVKRTGRKANIQLQVSGEWESGDLHVVQNGVRTFPSVTIKGDRCDVTGIRLTPGRNVLGFEIRLAQGESTPRTIVECDGGEVLSRPVVRALVVGIGDYPGTEADLPGAANDAKALADAIKHWDGQEQKVETVLLLNSQASPEMILQKIKELSGDSSPEDLLFVFIAGHGVNRMGEGYQVVGPKFQVGGELTDTLSLEKIVETMGNAGALRRVLVLDTCETGNAAALEFGYDVDELFPTPGIAAGVAIFGASRWNQVAFESEQTGHGFFSGALLDALRVDPFRPRVGDGTIKLSQMAEFVRMRVEQVSAGNQSPVMIARSWRGDMALLKSRELESYYRMFDSAVSGMGVKMSFTNGSDRNRTLPSAPYLRVIRNSIFARHGRQFEADDLKNHFSTLDFYHPDPAFHEGRLSASEREDVAWLAQSDGNSDLRSDQKQSSAGGVWMFPDSSLRVLSMEELGKLNAEGLWRARNEIYARHGFVFKSERGIRFTESLGAAYRPGSKDLDEIQSSLNEIERRNIENIQKKEGAK